jgi:hypothetical protein
MVMKSLRHIRKNGRHFSEAALEIGGPALFDDAAPEDRRAPGLE